MKRMTKCVKGWVAAHMEATLSHADQQTTLPLRALVISQKEDD